MTPPETKPAPAPWLTRAVAGMTLTSFFSDLGHEAQSTLLPSFMAALGLPPAALGAVEGIADATSSFVKLGAGVLSDRLGRRKPFVVAGYLATGLASGIIALAGGLPVVLLGKVFGWFGRGIRGPLRDAMLTDVAPPQARGRAFGFHRFGDTLGAVLGPLIAVALLAAVDASDLLPSMRRWMAITLIPGVLAALVFAIMVPERKRTTTQAPRPLHRAFRDLPVPFRRYLVGVGIFGAGDYAHTLMILAGAQLLTHEWGAARAAAIAAGMYVLHNVVYAIATYPAGILADRYGHRRVLGAGYALSVVVPLAWIACFTLGTSSIAVIAGVFSIGGFVNGVQDTLEGSATGGLVPERDRGLGFGVLGAVNGVGDLLSSVIVGALWTAHPALGFGYAALCMAVGALVVMYGARSGDEKEAVMT